MIQDIAVGNASSSPTNIGDNAWPRFAEAFGKTYFAADDRLHGLELWQADNGATAQPIGDVGATTAMTATDPVLGAIAQIAGTTGVASPVNCVLLGVAASTPLPLGGGCYSDVDLSVFITYAVTVNVSWQVPLPIVNDAAQIGVSAMLNWLRFGLVTQRTRAYDAERDVQRGLLLGLSFARIDLSAYWNPDDSDPIVIVAGGLGF